MTCPHTLDDGAYVLGALHPAERAEFEHHLSSCAPCREAVTALAVLPGLLGRLDSASVSAIAAAAPATLLPRLLTRAAVRHRAAARHRRWRQVATSAAALTIAVGVGVGVHLADSAQPAMPPLVAMQPVSNRVPVTAEVGLVAVAGGTRVVMTCQYAEDHEGSWVVRLYVYPRDGGDGEQIGTWTASSGTEISVQAITRLSPAQIARVELHRADNTTMLTWTPA
jgi:anti-sigma factor RsiW